MKLTRRTLIRTALSAAAIRVAPAKVKARLSLACMTLPWQGYAFERGVEGVARAGFRQIAWGPWFTGPSGKREPLLAQATPADAQRMAGRCRDAGVDPVLLFASHYPAQPDAVNVYKRRIEQAKAAGIRYVLCFGSPQGTDEEKGTWLKFLEAVGPEAQAAGVIIAVKQHGGIAATGQRAKALLAQTPHPSIRLFYDAGNVRWYTGVDPISDIETCASDVRGLVLKDFRALGKARATCGPGLGQIDHFALVNAIAANDETMPLVFETITEPFVPRPARPEDLDVLARRAREHMDTVLRALDSVSA